MRIEAVEFQSGELLKSLTVNAHFRPHAAADSNLGSATNLDEALLGPDRALLRPVGLSCPDRIVASWRQLHAHPGWDIRSAALFRKRRSRGQRQYETSNRTHRPLTVHIS